MRPGNSREASKTRLASMDAEERERTFTEDAAMETSVAVTGKGGRAPADGVVSPDESLGSQAEGCSVGDLH